MTCRCDNCGSNILPERVETIVHIPTRETAEACYPCARAMVRAMPTAWTFLPRSI
jgi:hypothetical protein